MAFHFGTFKVRAGTALVFVAIMLGGLLINHWSFLLLFSIVHFGAWIEYQRLVEKFAPSFTRIDNVHRYGAIFWGFCGLLYATGPQFTLGSFGLHNLAWWPLLIGALVFPLGLMLFRGDDTFKNVRYTLCGLLYISLPLALLVHLRSMPPLGTWVVPGWWIPVFLIASIWVNDTMAYLIGSFIGRTPLTRISPKKTWEGTVGGAVVAVLFCGFVLAPILPGYHDFPEGWRNFQPFVISGIAAVVGTVGDLVESKLKRMAGVKDSGQIMPGHGGFLDRFDSLLLAAPAVWLYLQLCQMV